MKPPLLQVQGLSVHFKLNKKEQLHAVDAIDFTLHEGEVLGLVGESGSGKSTVARTLIGLQEKTEGIVVYQGHKLPDKYKEQDFKDNASIMQMIFQDPYSSLNPYMTVYNILKEPLRLQSKLANEEDSEKTILKWLKKTGLPAHLLNRYPHELSGGQRQRVGIARALIPEPDLLICDEPISALDVSVQAQIVNLLSALQKSLSLSMLFIAHDLAMVRYISDRIIVMYMGVIVESGPANNVFNQPLHPYTQMLIASNPIADPSQRHLSTDNLIKGEIKAPINCKSGCRFYDRCPKAFAPCKHTTPSLIKHEESEVACHLYDPKYPHQDS